MKPVIRALVGLGLAVLPLQAAAQEWAENTHVFVADDRQLAGEYRFVDAREHAAVTLWPDADKTAWIRVTDDTLDREVEQVDGVWERDGLTIQIHTPEQPVSLDRLPSSERDPEIGLSIDIANGDGTRATGLGLSWPGLVRHLRH